MIANMAERVCDLHARGWVHRDLKPANIMWLPRTNRWTVIDFGCAAPRGAPLLSIPAVIQSALKAISFRNLQLFFNSIQFLHILHIRFLRPSI
jgi:serine/threonine protein kinase